MRKVLTPTALSDVVSGARVLAENQQDMPFTLEILDRGRGISEEKLIAINEGASGVGIRGMRDRVRHLNGEMKVHSNQSGTTVSITLPTYGVNSSPPLEDVGDFSAMVQAS